ncbi:hypothetical protein PZN02_003704 [Sinorhizobium garamanticum]|uniref:Transmembrane anchored protein n=1 Tax=Sinorhizobium garamanticum TaxID=680247 RepID=A0ABY8D8Y8_9HYPH|nr:hypothetical protein [Sinorhizobium garamanticum]WEX87324.1 hypothetical protein PZN02_003704 [Sinorhizobium garamanticum]
MNAPSSGPEPELSPLLSPRLLYKVTAVVALLAALTTIVSLSGHRLGEKLALAGHTSSQEIYDIFIGQDHLRLPANMIRFESQRGTSIAERIDLYLTWPALEGYGENTRNLFDDINRPENLIFLQLSQSTMSQDMSGRLEPIYRHVLSNEVLPGPAGLVRHDAKSNTSYAGEVFFTADRAGRPPYVLRCTLPADAEASTSADCQRDVHVGKDLTALYRFSSKLLPQWRLIDDSVETFVRSRLAP